MNRRKPYTLYAMLVLAALWIVFFLCAPYIAPFDPETTSVADRLQDISSTHLLGTDQLGRDVWSRIPVSYTHLTYELIGQARRIAKELGQLVQVMLLGEHVQSEAEELVAHGADIVHVFESPLLKYYTCLLYTSRLAPELLSKLFRAYEAQR